MKLLSAISHFFKPKKKRNKKKGSKKLTQAKGRGYLKFMRLLDRGAVINKTAPYKKKKKKLLNTKPNHNQYKQRLKLIYSSSGGVPYCRNKHGDL